MLFCVNRTAVVALFVAAGLTLSSAPVIAQTPRLEVELSNDYVGPGTTSGWVSAYIRNPVDSVAGFRIWMQLDRPDVIAFVQTTPPNLDYDTVGSLIGGWEIFDVRSKVGSVFDAQVVALADDVGPGPLKRGFGPSSTLRTLIRIPFVVLPGADTMTDATVHVLINYSFSAAFDFSTPDGRTIPWADSIGGQAIIDTMKIKVRSGSVSFNDGECVADGDFNSDGMVLTVSDLVYTTRVLAGMADSPDSVYHVDFNADCVVDSLDQRIYERYFDSGLIVFTPFPWPRPTCCNPVLRICCQGVTGNVDCDPQDNVDIADLTALIDNLYVSLSPLCCYGKANIDGDRGRSVDIADLTALIDRLYVSFSPPAACF